MRSRIVTAIKVQASKVGRVIGKGGKNIKEIRESSGVFRISVSDECVAGFHAVTISGPSSESCEMARRAIASVGRGRKFAVHDQSAPKRQQIIDGASDLARTIPPDHNWLTEISRRYVGWDGHEKRGAPLNLSIQESISRLLLDVRPPEFRAPTLPMPMPKPKTIKMTDLAWPRLPSIGLSLAVIKAGRETLDGINFIATAPFIYALCGEKQAAKESFLLQRVDDSIAVLSLRQKTPHCSFEIGVLVEDLCCPTSLPDTRRNFSLAKFQVGDHGLMLSGEVDGFESSTGTCIEVKSKSKPKLQMWEMLQASVNGSTQIACIIQSPDRMKLESLHMFSLHDERERHKDRWIYCGQRAKFLLSLFWENPLVQGSADAPVVMKFDEKKMPIFSLAPPDSFVIPADF